MLPYYFNIICINHMYITIPTKNSNFINTGRYHVLARPAGIAILKRMKHEIMWEVLKLHNGLTLIDNFDSETNCKKMKSG